LGKVWEDLSLDVITVDLGGGRRLCRQEAGSKDDDFRNDCREFQHIGPETAKAQEPNVTILLCGKSRLSKLLPA